MMIWSCILWAMFSWTASPRPQDEVPWLDNYNDAIREAKKSGKPIFLEFRCEA